MTDWRASRSKRVQAKLISIVGYRLVALLGSTFRWKSDGVDHYDRVVRRSEEHTSELQSRPHLVCRLLLEKKKIKLSTPAPARTKNPSSGSQSRSQSLTARG